MPGGTAAVPERACGVLAGAAWVPFGLVMALTWPVVPAGARGPSAAGRDRLAHRQAPVPLSAAAILFRVIRGPKEGMAHQTTTIRQQGLDSDTIMVAAVSSFCAVSRGTSGCPAGVWSAGCGWDIIGPADIWKQVLDGGINLSVAFRTRQLRYCDTGGVVAAVPGIRIAMLGELLGTTVWQPAEADGLGAMPLGGEHSPAPTAQDRPAPAAEANPAAQAQPAPAWER
jgi:hypothetical protein